MPKNTSLKHLSNETLLNIFDHLSPSSYLGSNNVGLVSSAFHALSNDRTLKYKKTKKALLEACQHDLTEAVTVLSDEAYFSLLTPQDIFDITSHHFEIAGQILFIPELVNSMSANLMVTLGQKHLATAELIFDTPELVNRLSRYDLIEIGKCHLKIAERILELFQLSNNHLLELGKYHPTIAEQILNSPLADTLNGSYLAHISVHSITLANRVLNTPHLAGKLSIDDLIILGENHVTIAEHVLETLRQTNSRHFNNVALHFGLKHLTIAEYILNTPALVDKLIHFQLRDLGIQHIVIAERILKNPNLVKKISHYDITNLGEKYIAIAEYILGTPNLVEKLDREHLKGLGIKHLAIAERIINTPALVNKFKNHELKDLGKCHIIIAENILKNSELADKLYSHDLRILGEQHLAIAEYILNTPTLFNKLTPTDQVTLDRLDRSRKENVVKPLATYPFTAPFMLHVQNISKKLLIEQKKTQAENLPLWSWDNKRNGPSSQRPKKQRSDTKSLPLSFKKSRLN